MPGDGREMMSALCRTGHNWTLHRNRYNKIRQDSRTGQNWTGEDRTAPHRTQQDKIRQHR